MANYSALPDVLCGRDARRAAAIIREAAVELKLIAMGRRTLQVTFHALFGSPKRGPLKIIGRLIDEQAEIGLDPEEAALLDQLSTLDFAGTQAVMKLEGGHRRGLQKSATP